MLVLGFGLRPESAYPIIEQFNQRCQPPWTDKELWHKLGDADKREGERGWLLREGGRYEGPDVDLRALLAGIEPIATTCRHQCGRSREQFPAECVPACPG